MEITRQKPIPTTQQSLVIDLLHTKISYVYKACEIPNVMDKKVWREQIESSEMQIKDSLVARVLKESDLKCILQPFAGFLGNYFLNGLWTAYMVNSKISVRYLPAVYWLHNSGLIDFDEGITLSDEGEKIFSDYLNKVLMEKVRGPDWEEECVKKPPAKAGGVK